jgi:hypothetical protein
MKKNSVAGNKLPYAMCLIVLSHAFNQLYRDTDNLKTIFKDYVMESKVDVKKFNYNHLRNWMTTSSEEKLTRVANAAIQLYFSN